MFERHADRALYFQEQVRTTEKFVIPYISASVKNLNSPVNRLNAPEDAGVAVLEIGCGEGGNLKPFLDRGCLVTAVDLSPTRIEQAQEFFANHPQRDRLKLFCMDIYESEDKLQQYDVIMLRDVIEHIPDQEKFMAFMKRFLKPEGVAFFAFPPWQNPFGGHQQICRSRVISMWPYLHLLPVFLYRAVLSLFGEPENRIKALLDIKETGISIERFKRIVKHCNYRILREDLYLINPNYETKFGLKPRKQWRLIAAIPWLRNFFTTAMYCVIQKE